MSDKKLQNMNFPQIIRLASIILVCGAYAYLFWGIKEKVHQEPQQIEKDEIDEKLFKLVDVEEYVPPVSVKVPEIKQPDPPEVKTETVTVTNNVQAAEEIVQTEKNVEEIVYLPQNKISKIPGLPTKKILSRIEYPSMAKKQGITGIVYLELFIDQEGQIRKIDVLKDPGHGFVEAALKALEGITVIPALVNDKPCAVRYRYPIRFSLK